MDIMPVRGTAGFGQHLYLQARLGHSGDGAAGQLDHRSDTRGVGEHRHGAGLTRQRPGHVLRGEPASVKAVTGEGGQANVSPGKRLVAISGLLPPIPLSVAFGARPKEFSSEFQGVPNPPERKAVDPTSVSVVGGFDRGSRRVRPNSRPGAGL